MTNAKSNKKGTIQIATMIMTDAISKTAHILMVIYIYVLYNSIKEIVGKHSEN